MLKTAPLLRENIVALTKNYPEREISVPVPKEAVNAFIKRATALAEQAAEGPHGGDQRSARTDQRVPRPQTATGPRRIAATG